MLNEMRERRESKVLQSVIKTATLLPVFFFFSVVVNVPINVGKEIKFSEKFFSVHG